MKVALVHDHLMQSGGAERVLAAMAKIYPDAPIYTLFSDDRIIDELNIMKDRVNNSYLQKMPFVKYYYRALLPFMAKGIESFDFSNFDIVLSSASSFAKGVKTSSTVQHVCYCHTPTRYLWLNSRDYIEALPYPAFFKKVVEKLLPSLKKWDREAADNVDLFVANSQEVASRIKKYYDKESVVIYPPRTLDVKERRAGNFYLTGGRLVAYKRFDTAVDAFTRLRLPLLVFGEGPDLKRLRAKAGQTIKFVGKITDDELADLYSRAKAFIHPQYEDFGITAIEAMASGCPVIAYGKGGAAETVVHGESGILYDEQSWPALADSVVRFDPETLDSSKLVDYADSFSYYNFKNKLTQLVDSLYESSC